MDTRQGLKIVTIGGGSSYTPELMNGFIKRYTDLPVKEIWLVDIPEGEEKLKIVGALSQRMWDATPYDVQVHLTLDRREALKDADFVTTQFRVGGMYARIKDERIPLSYGMLGQETNGAGGLFKCLRTVNVMEEVIADMKELCPDAWLINFTNPSGMVTEAIINRLGWKRCIGLCNVPVKIMLAEPGLINAKPGDLDYQFAGLDHFHFHRVYNKSDGKERTADIARAMADNPDPSIMNNIIDERYMPDQLQTMNCLPCSYHRYYYLYTDMMKHEMEDYENHNTRAEAVVKVEEECFREYLNPELHEMPEILNGRGGQYYSDAACECIKSIYSDTGEVMVASTQNKGALTDLPYNAVVEVSARITRHGPEPIAWGTFEAPERGMLQLMKSMEETIVDAALTGSYGRLLQAFQLCPVIEHGRKAKALMDELLVAHKRYLPKFAEKIAELEAEGVKVTDETSRELCEKGL